MKGARAPRLRESEAVIPRMGAGVECYLEFYWRAEGWKRFFGCGLPQVLMRLYVWLPSTGDNGGRKMALVSIYSIYSCILFLRETGNLPCINLSVNSSNLLK